MKKMLLPFFAVLLAAGCLSPEQKQKVYSFWLQQYAQVMMKKMAQQMDSLQNNPLFKNWSAQPQAPQTPPPPAAAPAKRPQPPQIMDVSMASDTLPGKASPAERAQMKRALDAVQLANQETLSDIAATFGNDVKYKAFLITTQTETKLKQAAAQSANFAAYAAAQKKLLQTQDTQLNRLMQQNVGSIKKIRR